MPLLGQPQTDAKGGRMSTIPPARPGKQLPDDGLLPPGCALLVIVAAAAVGVVLELLFPLLGVDA